MSYGVAAALQAAVWARLTGAAALTALVGGAVHDALPPGPVPQTWVAIGPEEVRDRSDRSGAGAEHEFTVSVVSAEAGFQTAKAVAGAVTDALNGADLTLARGRLVGLWFHRARARRLDDGAVRRIDVIFRARTEE